MNATPWRHYPREGDSVPVVYEAGWAPGPVRRGAKNLDPTGIRSLYRPSRSELLYRLSFCGPLFKHIFIAGDCCCATIRGVGVTTLRLLYVVKYLPYQTVFYLKVSISVTFVGHCHVFMTTRFRGTFFKFNTNFMKQVIWI